MMCGDGVTETVSSEEITASEEPSESGKYPACFQHFPPIPTALNWAHFPHRHYLLGYLSLQPLLFRGYKE